MIRTLLGTVVLAAGMTAAHAAPETFNFDKTHTKVIFAYSHVGMSNQYARFDSVDGEVVFDADKPENSKVSVTIDPASVDTDVKALDDHLKAEDFFNVAKYPKVTFVSTDVRKTGTKTYQITGTLTMKGKSHPVTLDATLNHIGDHPLAGFVKAYAGATYIGFSGKARIRRSDFDLGLYAPLTSDVVDIIIETEMRQKK
ncbi:MAG: YceI family protein [Burkholderiales bacterium]